MADEYFFALTLKGKNTNEVWDPEAKGAGAEDYQGGHKLIIKQALLGAEATEGEVNVIQVEAMTWKDSVKIPIATLKAGGPNNQVLLDLSFPDPPVTFTLIQGNGPVHIIGHHLIGGPIEEFDEMDEMEEEMIEDEEGEEGAFLGNSLEHKLGKKLGNFIARKLEEEEDDEEPKSKKAKTNNVNKGKTPVKNNAKPKK
ncbi:nucleoplasmin-like protein isoform X1 [Euwallacea fornicatus]|uniref:nucleoplasmin-like protein isoform X1 n=1 Tax=Euwallacea fornicatus TaxID=995702 RepID=UPI00338D5AEE